MTILGVQGFFGVFSIMVVTIREVVSRPLQITGVVFYWVVLILTGVRE